MDPCLGMINNIHFSVVLYPKFAEQNVVDHRVESLPGVVMVRSFIETVNLISTEPPFDERHVRLAKIPFNPSFPMKKMTSGFML